MERQYSKYGRMDICNSDAYKSDKTFGISILSMHDDEWMIQNLIHILEIECARAEPGLSPRRTGSFRKISWEYAKIEIQKVSDSSN